MYPLVLLGVGEEGRVGGGEVRKVKTGSYEISRKVSLLIWRQEVEPSLALTRKVILGLTDVHPESLQVKRVQLVVGSDGREDLLFDRSRSELS